MNVYTGHCNKYLMSRVFWGGFHRGACLSVLTVLHGGQQPQRGDEPVRLLHGGPELFTQLPEP